MLITLSDLHFAESGTYQLGDRQFNHNLPASVYKAYFREIADLIRDEFVERIDIVLAGDIFEINRSVMWFKDSLRPYVNNSEVEPGSALEDRILEIIDDKGNGVGFIVGGDDNDNGGFVFTGHGVSIPLSE